MSAWINTSDGNFPPLFTIRHSPFTIEMIIRADARHIPLANESVQCVVTSPPYWGLRKYAGQQELIWDSGFETRDSGECRHEWATELYYTEQTAAVESGEVFSKPGNANSARLKAGRWRESNTCRICGAWRGAYGLEPTVEMYVQHTILILREIRRVLRPDGVVFWNIGDSYATGAGKVGNCPGGGEQGDRWAGRGEHTEENSGKEAYRLGIGPMTQPNRMPQEGLKPKDLCLIPARVALAAQADGWWVRSDIIWSKPNPMPESVTGCHWERHRRSFCKACGGFQKFHKSRCTACGGNSQTVREYRECPGCEVCIPNDPLVRCADAGRPTDAYEHILMLTKSPRYYWDAEAVREPASGANVHDLTGPGYAAPGQSPHNGNRDSWHGSRLDTGKTAEHQCQRMQVRDNSPFTIHNFGRNLRNLWHFATQPYAGAHFATFPEELPRRCILAATSECGCCPKCGSPWERIVSKSGGTIGQSWHNHQDDIGRGQRGGDDGHNLAAQLYDTYKVETLGWRPGCQCASPESRLPNPCLVLDPFGGSGTTAKVATELNRRAVSLDLAYHHLAKKRLTNLQPVLPVSQ